MIYIVLFIFGAIAGSFMTVCVYRLPRNKSIVMPRSHCPKCDKPIAWYDNVPILSYIVLRGRCRQCGKNINLRYLLVELLSAAGAVVLFIKFGLTFNFLIIYYLYCALVVATFVDFEFKEIPDEITISGILLGLVLSFLHPALLGKTSSGKALLDSLLGLIAGGGSIYLIGFLGEMVFRKEAMGGGDVKLLAMVGTFIGWKLVLLVFFAAPIFGAVAGVILKLKEGKDIIPYGPYLSLATVIVVLWGERFLRFLFVY